MQRGPLRLAALLVALACASAAVDLPSAAIELLWPSPLLNLHDPLAEANNKALRKAILRIARTEPGVIKTNVGGWQSEVGAQDTPTSAAPASASSARARARGGNPAVAGAAES